MTQQAADESGSSPEPGPVPRTGSPTVDPGRAGCLRRYRCLFQEPGAVAFTLAGTVARLPAGMLSVAAVLMITAYHGSYALAGAVTATGLAATALVAPLTARLVDRYGQSRVAVPAVLLAAAGQLALVACVVGDAPLWTLFATSAAVSPAPNVGAMSRARWAHRYRTDPAARHTANSLEQALDELCFMSGPVLAAVLCTAVAPTAGSLTAIALMVGGTVLFAGQRRTEPPVPARDRSGGGSARNAASARSRSPLWLRGMKPVLAAFVCTGAIFGSLEVATIAFADARGQQGWAGAVLATQALGSALAGLAFGVFTLSGRVSRHFVWCTAAMAALMTLPLLVSTAGSLPLLAPALLLAGMATAPTMVTGMTLVQRITPEGQLNEGMTLAVTALLTGIAAGAATGGWVAERLADRPGLGYLVPVSAAALAALLAATVVSRRDAPLPATTAGEHTGLAG